MYHQTADMIINGITLGHLLYDGYIVCCLAVDHVGFVNIWTASYGANSTCFLSWFNEIGGLFLFKNKGDRKADNIRKRLSID